MRTTLNIDDDILMAAKERARRYQISVGQALSNLAREALERQQCSNERHGIPLFPKKAAGKIVTPELVQELLNEDS